MGDQSYYVQQVTIIGDRCVSWGSLGLEDAERLWCTLAQAINSGQLLASDR